MKSKFLIISISLIGFLLFAALVVAFIYGPDYQKTNSDSNAKVTQNKSVKTNETTNKSDWKKEFIEYRKAHNSDVAELIIDESVLYIYFNKLPSDWSLVAKMYTLQFQKAYSENTHRNNIGTLVYLKNKLVKEYSADNNGLK